MYDEKNDINEVLPVIRMVDKTQGVDIYSLSFDDLRNQLNVNKPDDYIPLPNPFYFSSDKTVEIGHITSWDESKEIPQAKSWCISRKEESWDDFVKNRGYRFFIIRDSKCLYKKNARHVIVSVAKNGSWWFVDSDDDTMVDYHIGTERTDNHMLKSDYIKSIGEGAMKAIQDKIITNENKRYKNMNRKNTIRLTESKLKEIITECVKEILSVNEEILDEGWLNNIRDTYNDVVTSRVNPEKYQRYRQNRNYQNATNAQQQGNNLSASQRAAIRRGNEKLTQQKANSQRMMDRARSEYVDTENGRSNPYRTDATARNAQRTRNTYQTYQKRNNNIQGNNNPY